MLVFIYFIFSILYKKEFYLLKFIYLILCLKFESNNIAIFIFFAFNILFVKEYLLIMAYTFNYYSY